MHTVTGTSHWRGICICFTLQEVEEQQADRARRVRALTNELASNEEQPVEQYMRLHDTSAMPVTFAVYFRLHNQRTQSDAQSEEVTGTCHVRAIVAAQGAMTDIVRLRGSDVNRIVPPNCYNANRNSRPGPRMASRTGSRSLRGSARSAGNGPSVRRCVERFSRGHSKDGICRPRSGSFRRSGTTWPMTS